MRKKWIAGKVLYALGAMFFVAGGLMVYPAIKKEVNWVLPLGFLTAAVVIISALVILDAVLKHNAKRMIPNIAKHFFGHTFHMYSARYDKVHPEYVLIVGYIGYYEEGRYYPTDDLKIWIPATNIKHELRLSGGVFDWSLYDVTLKGVEYFAKKCPYTEKYQIKEKRS